MKQYKKTHQQNQETNHTGNVMVSFLAIITVVLCGSQIFLAGRVATTGDRIKNLEIERSRLHEEISTLKSDIAGAASIATIEEKAHQDLHMSKIGDALLYIPLETAPAFAARN